MALVVRATASAGGVHVGPPGLYDAVISDVKQDHLAESKFGTGDIIRFYAKLHDVMDADGDPVIIDAIANLLLTPMSKLWSWLEALGVSPEVGYDIDIESVVGKPCVLSIIDNVKDGTTFSRVDGIFPAKRQQLTVDGLLTPTGGINWTAFWAECGRRHINREMVAEYLGGDINTITVMPVLDVLQLLEELKGI